MVAVIIVPVKERIKKNTDPNVLALTLLLK